MNTVSSNNSGAASDKRDLRVGLCGLGTVGQALVDLLHVNAAQIEAQAGRPVRLVQVASRSAKPGVDLHGAGFATDIDALVDDPDVDVVVELIGGETKALELSRKTLDAGKSLVTGNKALLALHGEDLFSRARKNGATIGLEAAVAGGIPLINALLSGLGGNQVEWVAGIINGTCNYILTAMTEEGADLPEVLKRAQELGYAEADPTFDVGGIDAAHKIAIIAGLVFGVSVDFSDVPVSGIDCVAAEDIEYARQLGYRVKHLGVAAAERDAAGQLTALDVRAHAALVPEDVLLAGINGVTNAAMVKDNAVGLSLYAGPGAGGAPTAASVVADLIRVAQGVPMMGADSDACENGSGQVRMKPIEESEAPFYLRIPVLDRPGVLAKISHLLGQEGISIESVIQREQAVRKTSGTHVRDGADRGTDAENRWVPIVLLTQRVAQGALGRALQTIAASADVVGEIVSIRVETLGDA